MLARAAPSHLSFGHPSVRPVKDNVSGGERVQPPCTRNLCGVTTTGPWGLVYNNITMTTYNHDIQIPLTIELFRYTKFEVKTAETMSKLVFCLATLCGLNAGGISPTQFCCLRIIQYALLPRRQTSTNSFLFKQQNHLIYLY